MDKDQLTAALKKHFSSETTDEKSDKEATAAVEKTDPLKSANENVDAGGHPTGTVPGGTT